MCCMSVCYKYIWGIELMDLVILVYYNYLPVMSKQVIHCHILLRSLDLEIVFRYLQ